MQPENSAKVNLFQISSALLFICVCIFYIYCPMFFYIYMNMIYVQYTFIPVPGTIVDAVHYFIRGSSLHLFSTVLE